MQNMQTLTRFVLLALASGLPGLVQAAEAAPPVKAAVKTHVALSPEDVGWGPCPAALPAGAQCAVVEGDPKTPDALFALRARLPDGYTIPPHWHPADEHVVVFSGTFNMGTGETLDRDKGHPLPAGGFMVMPAGERHFAWATGETVIQVYAIGPWAINYVNAEDDPRNRAK